MIDKVAHVIFTEELYDVRRTALIFSEPWEKISEADRGLLDKILLAIRLTVNDVDIIHQPTLNLTDLKTPPRRVIYFGKPAGNLATFEATQLDGVPLVVAPPLSNLHTDGESKKKLWAALQTLFAR